MKHLASAIAVAILALSFAPDSHAQQGKPGMGLNKTGKKTGPPKLPPCNRQRSYAGIPCR